LQQVALARERALSANDSNLAAKLGKLMDDLTIQLAAQSK